MCANKQLLTYGALAAAAAATVATGGAAAPALGAAAAEAGAGAAAGAGAGALGGAALADGAAGAGVGLLATPAVAGDAYLPGALVSDVAPVQSGGLLSMQNLQTAGKVGNLANQSGLLKPAPDDPAQPVAPLTKRAEAPPAQGFGMIYNSKVIADAKKQKRMNA